MLNKVAKTHGGCIPYIQGPSNGLLQYIYAGNLAEIMEENMRLLLKSPERCSNEFLYCMDQTECILFSDVCYSFMPLMRFLVYQADSQML
jgi:hypothetical protein